MYRRGYISVVSIVVSAALGFWAPPMSQAQNKKQATKQPVKTKDKPKESPSTTNTVTPPASGQESSASTPAPAPGGASASAVSKIGDAALATSPERGGDYIPCQFTFAELHSLHAPDLAVVLSPSAAEALVQRVINAAKDEMVKGDLDIEDFSELQERLSKESLAGLTPSQALAKVIRALRDSRSRPLSEKEKRVYLNEVKKLAACV